MVFTVSILTLILGFLVGLYISHHHIVVPCWETERELRKDLKEARRELWVVLQREVMDRPPVPTFIHHKVLSIRHSEVLFIPHPEDLLE